MNKSEILHGMKMTRMVQDKLAEKKFVLRNEINSDTQVTPVSGGSGIFAFSYGDTQPLVKSLWLDTSEFASIQGPIPTKTIYFENGKSPLIVSDTKPTETNIFWLNTSGGD